MENASVILYGWGPHRTTFDTRVVVLPRAALDLKVAPERIRQVGARADHMVYALFLSTRERVRAEKRFGMQKLGDILLQPDASWATIGMIMAAVLQNQTQTILDSKKRKRSA